MGLKPNNIDLSQKELYRAQGSGKASYIRILFE